MNIYLVVIGALLLSLISGLIVIPKVIRYCTKHDLFDQYNARKLHKTAIPRLGGICFLPIAVLALAIVIVCLINGDATQTVSLNIWTLAFFWGQLTVYLLGFIDDIIGIKAKTKFVIQIIAASLLPFSGLYLHSLGGILGIYEIHWIIGSLLSIFIIVYICNAINLIDGIDGLAAGLSIIAFSGFLIMFMASGMIVYSALIASIIGVLTAYFRFNVFGSEQRQTKIFMGDAGSLSIGFTLAFLFLKASTLPSSNFLFGQERLIMACSLLAVPVFDVVRVSICRIRHHVSIFTPDKNHIHHKLLRAGLNQHQALVAIISFAVLIIIVNALIVKILNPTIILSINIVIWLFFNHCINRSIKKLGRRTFLRPSN